MIERDDHLSEGFLVEGMAPSVIGGETNPGPASDHGSDTDDFDPRVRREPPTTPIPAQSLAQGPAADPARSRPEQRKGWLGRMFGRG